MNKKLILLPGLDKQIKFLNGKLNLDSIQCLVIGSSSAMAAKKIQKESGTHVNVIVEDYESMMNTKLELGNSENVSAKMMDFERTDFSNKTFDLVYSQGSISSSRRKKIVKEIKRISKSDGYLCVGEIVKLQDKIPNFVRELFEYSNLDPMDIKQLLPYYEERNFELVDSIDLTKTMKEYYQSNIELLKNKINSLSQSEKSYYKKILNQISHESNAYLKLGADKFIGFEVLLLKMAKK